MVHPKGSMAVADRAPEKRTIKWTHNWATRACLRDNIDWVFRNVHLDDSLRYYTYRTFSAVE
jgi:hypothetical protein